MRPILFEKTATDFSTRGIFTLSDCVSCVVTEERNGQFELELTYPSNGEFFDEIVEDRIIVAMPYEGGTKQAFRIYRHEANLEGTVTFFARHISYQLNFIPVDVCSGTTTSAQTMMESLASNAQGTNPFTMSSDITSVNAKNWFLNSPSGLRSALGGQEGSALDTWGGEFKWDNWTVNLLASRGADNGVRIAYGKNITSLEDAFDIGDTITGVMAFYQYQDDTGTDHIVYTDPKVISLANTYAHARVVALDLSSNFEGVPTQAALTAYATSWLGQTESTDPAREINVEFVPFHQTAEYAYDESLDSVHLCDTVHVRYPLLGIDVKKKVTRTVWNVLADRYDEITLGKEDSLVDTIVELQDGGKTHYVTTEEVKVMLDTLKSTLYTKTDVAGLLNGHLTVSTVSKSLTVNHSSYKEDYLTGTKAGYYPIGVVGWDIQSTGSTNAVMGDCYVSSASNGSVSVYIRIRNLHTSENYTWPCVAYVLWRKIQ